MNINIEQVKSAAAGGDVNAIANWHQCTLSACSRGLIRRKVSNCWKNSLMYAAPFRGAAQGQAKQLVLLKALWLL